MCANKGCQWSRGRRRQKGGMEGLDCLEPCMSMSMIGLEKELTLEQVACEADGRAQ